MKRIVRFFLMAIAILFAIYFFSIDYVLKAVLQSEGSKVLRAQLDIGDVTFHLLPTSIRLQGLQLTNPSQPLRNIIEFETLSTPLSIDAIIAQKIDLPELELHGLRFNTTRVHSGAIAGLTPLEGGVTDALALPDPAYGIAQQKQQLQDELNKTKQDLTVIYVKWQQRLQQLPDDSRLEAYRQRAQMLQSGNNTTELAQLRQELSNELGGVRKLADEFELDMQHTRAQLTYAQALPQRGANNFGAPQNFGNIAGALLGSEFSTLLKPLLQQIPAIDGEASAAQSSVDPSNMGQPNTADAAPAWPLLIRKVVLDGQLDLGAQPLQFAGTIDNLTPQPRFWNVATAFALDGVPTQSSKFNARGSADFRKTASIDMRFDLRDFPLQQLPLSKNPQLGVVIKRAVADMQGLLSLTGNQLDLNLLSHFQQAALDVQAANDPLAQALAGVLRDTTDFDLNVQASGDVQKPTFKVDSNLNQRLGAALNQQLQTQQADTAPGGLSATLQRELAPALAGIQQLATEFENLQRQLLAKQSALQSIMGQ